MKAIVCTDYGPPEVLQLREVKRPVPREDEVLIRIRATTVSAADCEIRRFDFPAWIWLPLRLWFGLQRPRRLVLGQELAGDVESVGAAVRSFKKGDRVFATTGVGLGAHAEYICLREHPLDGALATMPANLSYEEAAAVPYGGSEALRFLRKGNIRTGQKILVIGAGGTFGTFAVQLAKFFGAYVTAVDRGPKLDMLRAIGADQVIDYTSEDFTKAGEVYDIVFDVVRNSVYSQSMKSLRQDGRYLLANPGTSQVARGLWISTTSNKKVILGASPGTSEDLIFLKGLIEAGKLRSVIDRQYPLEHIVEAHRYVETGQKKGNVVVVVP